MTNGSDVLEYIQDNQEGILNIWCDKNGVDIDALLADEEWLDEVLQSVELCEIATSYMCEVE